MVTVSRGGPQALRVVNSMVYVPDAGCPAGPGDGDVAVGGVRHGARM